MDYFFFDCVYFFVFFKGCGDHRDLPSFPTRRSSDLNDSEGRPSLWSSQASWKALAGSKPTKSDRKSTRLNSSHLGTSYAALCLSKPADTPAALCHSPRPGSWAAPPGLSTSR